MCGIVAIHYFSMGGAVQNAEFPNFSWLFTHFVNAFAVPLVNCFVLITGYFQIKKRTLDLKKPVTLLLITAFYGLLSYAIALLAGEKTYSGGILYALAPYFWGNRWFVETYIILILFSPFINKLLLSLTRKQYLILLSIQLVFFCLWYSVGLSAPLLDDGYGIINFITLYMIGGYIRLFGHEIVWLNRKRMVYAAIYIGCSLMTFLLSYFIYPYGYAFITNIIGSTAAFLFFLRWDLGTKRVVNMISKASFDVYFIHSDANTSRLFIYEILGARFVADTPWIIPHLLFVVLVMWVLGEATHGIRNWIFAGTVDRLLNKIPLFSKNYEI